MSLQSDIITALATAGITNVYPQHVPADVDIPFIVYRVLSKSPTRTLNKTKHQTNSTVAFECYADDPAEAVTLASSVVTAIDASALVSYLDSSPGDDYEQMVAEYMEPVFFGFWHDP